MFESRGGMQNLNNDAPTKLVFHCKWCAKKFKTQRKHEHHIISRHPFAAFMKNTFMLQLDEKLWLLDELEKYATILTRGSTSDFERATRALGEDDMSRMVTIHATFRERILPHLNKALSSGVQVLCLIDEFQAFLKSQIGKAKRRRFGVSEINLLYFSIGSNV
jgi:hypothetical protein